MHSRSVACKRQLCVWSLLFIVLSFARPTVSRRPEDFGLFEIRSLTPPFVQMINGHHCLDCFGGLASVCDGAHRDFGPYYTGRHYYAGRHCTGCSIHCSANGAGPSCCSNRHCSIHLPMRHCRQHFPRPNRSNERGDTCSHSRGSNCRYRPCLDNGRGGHTPRESNQARWSGCLSHSMNRNCHCDPSRHSNNLAHLSAFAPRSQASHHCFRCWLPRSIFR